MNWSSRRARRRRKTNYLFVSAHASYPDATACEGVYIDRRRTKDRIVAQTLAALAGRRTIICSLFRTVTAELDH